MSIFTGYEPFAPLSFFEQISAVPRGSRNEAGIADWLVAFAEARGLWVYRDAHHNVLIKKSGQHGGEKAEPLMLQGHSDIVCEKNQGTDFDFEKDGLRLKIVDGKLIADGTTLGNDDGYAMAYMLAVLDDSTIPHPPVQCLFTSMEEIGLIGAQLFDCSQIEARRLIGMDGGREGQIMIGSAGGMQIDITVPAPREAYSGAALAIKVRGLAGGHSGALIHKGLGNANSILGRLLYRLSTAMVIRVSAISGGDKGNAIPRESDCVIALPADKLDAAKALVAELCTELQAEFAFSDKGLYIESETASVDSVMTADASARCLAFQHTMPNGVVAMSRAIEGLVDSSQNFASVRTVGEELRYVLTVRSATDSRVGAVAGRIVHLAETLGGEAACSAVYPAYTYNPVSPLREMATRLWKQLDGGDMDLQAAQGGTELGVFSKNLPGLDIITIGPIAGGAHTPEEWVDIASFGKIYRFLLVILAELCK